MCIRDRCRLRGIELKTRLDDPLLALTFQEVMSGHFALGTSRPEEGLEKGRIAHTTITMHASIRIDNLDRFLSEPDHQGDLGGTLDFPPMGVGLPVNRGVFN